MQTTVKGSYDSVKIRVTQALQEQGFGLLTEIDMQQTLKDKIGVDLERYEILGACNPQLAHQALTVDRTIGLLLPCNVVLRETGDEVEVSILDAEKLFELVGESNQAALAGVAVEAKKRLEGVISDLSTKQGGLQ